MRIIAEFVMRSRLRAIGVCLIGSSLPFLHWLSASVVSLVVLRKGVVEGTIVLLWAALPLLLLSLLVGDFSPLVLLTSSALLAYVLRVTVSWEITLLTTVMVTGIAILILDSLGTIDAQLAIVYKLQRTIIDANNAVDRASTLSLAALREGLIGFIAVGFALFVIALLTLSRWWQSVLYHPGGFKQEFHHLRLSPAAIIPLLLLITICIIVMPLNRWTFLPMVPLLTAGLGIIHWLIDYKQLTSGWMFGFYCALLILPVPMMSITAMVAVLDSFFDLRQRI